MTHELRKRKHFISLPCNQKLISKHDNYFPGETKILLCNIRFLILVAITSLFTNGLNQGVDFAGGRSYTVRFDKAINSAMQSDLLLFWGMLKLKFLVMTIS